MSVLDVEHSLKIGHFHFSGISVWIEMTVIRVNAYGINLIILLFIKRKSAGMSYVIEMMHSPHLNIRLNKHIE